MIYYESFKSIGMNFIMTLELIDADLSVLFPAAPSAITIEDEHFLKIDESMKRIFNVGISGHLAGRKSVTAEHLMEDIGQVLISRIFRQLTVHSDVPCIVNRDPKKEEIESAFQAVSSDPMFERAVTALEDYFDCPLGFKEYFDSSLDTDSFMNAMGTMLNNHLLSWLSSEPYARNSWRSCYRYTPEEILNRVVLCRKSLKFACVPISYSYEKQKFGLQPSLCERELPAEEETFSMSRQVLESEYIVKSSENNRRQ